MENETDKPKSSLLSKALGVLEMAIAGGFTAARYVRGVVKEKILRVQSPNYFEMSDQEILLSPKVKADLHNPATVLGAAYEKVKKTPKGEKLFATISHDAKEAEHAHAMLAELTAKEIPLTEKLMMRNLHLTGSQKAKAGLIFATVGSVSGYAVYKVASWLHKDETQLQR